MTRWGAAIAAFSILAAACGASSEGAEAAPQSAEPAAQAAPSGKETSASAKNAKTASATSKPAPASRNGSPLTAPFNGFWSGGVQIGPEIVTASLLVAEDVLKLTTEQKSSRRSCEYYGRVDGNSSTLMLNTGTSAPRCVPKASIDLTRNGLNNVTVTVDEESELLKTITLELMAGPLPPESYATFGDDVAVGDIVVGMTEDEIDAILVSERGLEKKDKIFMLPKGLETTWFYESMTDTRSDQYIIDYYPDINDGKMRAMIVRRSVGGMKGANVGIDVPTYISAFNSKFGEVQQQRSTNGNRWETMRSYQPDGTLIQKYNADYKRECPDLPYQSLDITRFKVDGRSMYIEPKCGVSVINTTVYDRESGMVERYDLTMFAPRRLMNWFWSEVGAQNHSEIADWIATRESQPKSGDVDL